MEKGNMEKGSTKVKRKAAGISVSSAFNTDS